MVAVGWVGARREKRPSWGTARGIAQASGVLTHISLLLEREIGRRW